MDRTSQNDGTTISLAALGIQVSDSEARMPGVPRGLPSRDNGIGDTFAATPMHAWDTTIEIRDTYAWQRGRHGIKFGGEFHRYIWPMWGFFPESWLLQLHTGYTTEFGFNDGSGSGLASMCLAARREATPGCIRKWICGVGSCGVCRRCWQVTSTTTLNLARYNTALLRQGQHHFAVCQPRRCFTAAG